MAFVVKRGKSNDQTNEVIGLLTLEDVIEEIIQVEIVDEHDVIGGLIFLMWNNRLRAHRQQMKSYLVMFS